jgi:RNA polymerase sigma-70 factor, ECF subfamily
MPKRIQYQQPEEGKNLERETRLRALMIEAQAGHKDSYQVLLSELSQLLLKFVSGMLLRFGMGSSGAQHDVLQEILMAIHTHRASYNPANKFLPWAFAIAKYKSIDCLRKMNRTHWKKTLSTEESLLDIEAQVHQSESLSHDFETLLLALNEKQKQIFQLIKVEGLSIKEVNTRTGYSESDIKVTTHRALILLKSRLQELGYES